METGPIRAQLRIAFRLLLASTVLLVSSCDDDTARNPYFEKGPDENFSHYQLQCAVDAIQDQRQANSKMRSWESCQSSLPRLEKLQAKLREDWEAAELEKWNKRCANEIVSLRDACEQKRDAALLSPPKHLRVPPEYPSLVRPRITVADYQWRRSNRQPDIQAVAAGIVMDKVESDSKLASSLFGQLPASSAPRPVQTQEERDLFDLRTGICAIWIGREPPDASLLTEGYLQSEIAGCMGE